MPSIGVLEHFQKVTDQPTRRVKRSGGQSLVNRGLAVWIRENVLLKMRDHAAMEVCANQATMRLKSTPNARDHRAYIPEKLPANIDYQLGLRLHIPSLAGQVRFRAIAEHHCD